VARWHNFTGDIKNLFAGPNRRTAETAFLGPRSSGFDFLVDCEADSLTHSQPTSGEFST
jgi:hypothetical protein